MKLNIHLFRDDVQRFQDCLRPLTEKRRYKQIGEGPAGDGGSYRIYRTTSHAKTPPRVALLKDHVEEGTLDDVENLSQAAIILLRVPTADGLRFFGVTHGHGHFLVDRDRIELGFGLKTTLNAVDPDQLTLADSRSVEMQARQKRVGSNVGVGLGALAYDGATEILRIGGGKCEDAELGLRLDGSDNLHITVPCVDFERLPDKCKELYDVYRTNRYKEHFAFIDDKSFVKETGLVRALEDHLAAALQAEQSDARIAVVSPDLLDDRDCVYHVISGLGTTSPALEALSLSAVHDYLRDVREGRGVDRDHLRRVKIMGLDDNLVAKSTQESLLSYLVFETEHAKGRYVLSNGKWYQIDGAYFRRLKAQLDALRRCETPKILDWGRILKKHEDPAKSKWMHDEGSYNKQYAQDPEFLVLDRKNCTKHGLEIGNTAVEIADLFHWPTKKFLCVKRWDRSRTMSHLLSQASVSAKLLRRSEKYRDEVLRQIREKWPNEVFPDDPNDFLHGCTFVYVIASDAASPMTVEGLPVFSKVNMLVHVQAIQEAGFKVEVAEAKMVQAEMKLPPEPVAQIAVPKKSSRSKSNGSAPRANP